MKKILVVLILTCCTGLYSIFSQPNIESAPSETSTLNLDSPANHTISETEKLYHEINLDGKLNFEAFELALNGRDQFNFKNKNIISIIDFTLPSTEKRMYVIDLDNKKLLYHTIVSHGRNSGEKYATSFSNKHGSYQSSLGFYTTEATYNGGNGYSLVLDGLEKGINDQAKPRAVVIHGADYCSLDVIRNTGRLGRSYGCPALPRELNTAIINTIKNGSMLFIYAKEPSYFAKSKIANHSKTLIAQHNEGLENEAHTMN